MSYEKDRFINNVYALVKKRKLKIGELEVACGVSTGYFARLRQGGKEAAPAANLLMAFADYLSVSVDALLSLDFTRATELDQKLLNYIEKLRSDTESRRLCWQRDPVGCGNPVPLNPDGTSAHPLFINKEALSTGEDPEEDGLPESVFLSESVYRSVFRPDLDDLVPLQIYRCYFFGKRTLYLAAVTEQGLSVNPSVRLADLELVMIDPNVPDPIPFARTDHKNPGFLDKALISLFTAVKKAIDFPALRPEANAIINDYLKLKEGL